MEFMEDDVVSVLFEFLVMEQATRIHWQLLVFWTVRNENFGFAARNIQIHEASREDNQVREDVPVRKSNREGIACPIRKTTKGKVLGIDGEMGI